MYMEEAKIVSVVKKMIWNRRSGKEIVGITIMGTQFDSNSH